MRILIAEDEYYARKALAASVCEWDEYAETEQAENGLEALEMLRQKNYDILLLDIKMPQMDGMTLIQQLISESIDVYTVITSAYSEFDFARNAMKAGVKDYLLKPINRDKLCEVLETAYDVISQQRGSTEKRINDAAAWVNGVTARPEWIPQGVSCFTAGVTGSDMSIYEFFRMDGLITIPYRKTIGWTAALFMDLQSREENPGCSTLPSKGSRLFISSRFPASQVVEAAHQLNSLYNFRCLMPGNVITADALSGRTEYPNMMNMEQFSIFGDLLSDHKEEKASAVAQELINQYLDDATLSPYCVQDAISQLCAQMNRVSAQNKQKEGIHLRLSDMDDRKTLVDAVCGMIHTICRLPFEKPNHQKQIINTICAYIDSHYAENISLKMLANTRFYLNESYLSRLFKAETGQSFHAYLTEVRLNKAREQIRLREESITQIAARCGYTDVSHFIQHFRRRFGLTPNAWRETYLSHNNEKVK